MLLVIQRRKTALAGLTILVIFFPTLVLSLLWSWLSDLSNPYLDFFNYLVFAPMILLGLILLVVGLMQRGGEDIGLYAYEYLREQMITPGRHLRIRKFILMVAGLSLLFFFIVMATLYGGMRYTDTTDFCATFCHSVMEPHAATHARSSHSQVACATCHIARHTGWATRTKLTGLTQIIATLSNTYARPIASPINRLRPTEQTCRGCHRPETHLGLKIKILDHFQDDAANSHLQTLLLLKIGEEDHLYPTVHGIHWHVSEQHTVRYLASADRKEISIVKVEQRDGRQTTYFRDGGPDDTTAETELRRLDCLDCHNRAGHPFLKPEEAVDKKLKNGEIPSDLPFIRQLALDAIRRTYGSREQARIAISRAIRTFYQEHYPSLAKKRKESITKAITATVAAWEGNVFPEMNVTWNTYTDMLSHEGCFRCHNDQMRTIQGRPIPSDCNLCHLVLAERVPPAKAAAGLKGALPPRRQ